MFAPLVLARRARRHAAPPTRGATCSTRWPRSSSATRSELKLRENQPPYFISYQLKDYDQREVHGAATARSSRRHAGAIGGSTSTCGWATTGSTTRSRDDFDFSFSTKGTSYLARKNGPLDDSPAGAAHRALAHHRREVQGRALQLPQEEGRGRLRGRRPEAAALVLQGDAARSRLGRALAFRFDASAGRRSRASCRRALAAPARSCSTRRCASAATRWCATSSPARARRIVTEETLYGVHVHGVDARRRRAAAGRTRATATRPLEGAAADRRRSSAAGRRQW